MTHKFFTNSKILAIALIVTASLFTGQYVHADQPVDQMTASPAKIRLDLKSGKKTNGSFQIINSSKKPLEFKVYAKPYSVTNSKYDPNFENQTNYTQISRWIEFEQEKYKLPANKTQIVNFTVNTPNSIPDGGQYAMIMAESINKNMTNNINVIKKLGITVYAQTDGKTNLSGKLKPINIPLIQTDSKIKINLSAVNDGNVDFDLKTQAKITDLFGNVKFSRDTSHIILPNSNRDIVIDWDKAPAIGLFKLKLSNQYLGQEQSHEQYLLFLSPMVTIILVVLILSLFIGLIYIFKNKRRA